MGTYTRIPFPSAFSKYQTVLDAASDLVAAGVFDGAFTSFGLAAFGVANSTFASGQSSVIATLIDPFANLGLGTTVLSTFGVVPGQLALSNGAIVPGSMSGVPGAFYSIGILATAGNGTRLFGEMLTFLCTASAGAMIPSGAVGTEDGNGVGTEDGRFILSE